MHLHRHWLFIAFLVIAPVAVAQSAPKRLSADAGCARAPELRHVDSGTLRLPPLANATSDAEASGSSSGCADCGDEHFVPRRWHRFLPGMYR